MNQIQVSSSPMSNQSPQTNQTRIQEEGSEPNSPDAVSVISQTSLTGKSCLCISTIAVSSLRVGHVFQTDRWNDVCIVCTLKVPSRHVLRPVQTQWCMSVSDWTGASPVSFTIRVRIHTYTLTPISSHFGSHVLLKDTSAWHPAEV